jgi:hypothetical protein
MSDRNRPKHEPAPEAELEPEVFRGLSQHTLIEPESEAARTADCWSCQTFTASPAEPDDLSSD